MGRKQTATGEREWCQLAGARVLSIDVVVQQDDDACETELPSDEQQLPVRVFRFVVLVDLAVPVARGTQEPWVLLHPALSNLLPRQQHLQTRHTHRRLVVT